MHDTQRRALKAEVAEQPEPQIVAAERFSNGNDDPGSLDCNLLEHPELTLSVMFSPVCFTAQVCRRFTRRFQS